MNHCTLSIRAARYSLARLRPILRRVVGHLAIALLLNLSLVLMTNPTSAQIIIWDGDGGNNAWSTALNWNTDTAPVVSTAYDYVFAGTIRPAPLITNNYVTHSISFSRGAAAFTIGGNPGNSIDLNSGGGVTNNSTNVQTISTIVIVSSSETFSAANGDLVFSGELRLNPGRVANVAGSHNTTFSGTVTQFGNIIKVGTGR